MKRLFLLFLCSKIYLAQAQIPFCGNDWMPTDPATQILHEKLEQQAFEFFSGHQPSTPDASNVVLTIPVVVHIIHDNGPENISDAQVQQAIAWLNDAYANAGYYDQGSGTDVGVQFCLAQRTPGGMETNGITRNQSALTSMTLESQDIALKNLNHWNSKQYLNIWLVREICSSVAGCGVVGYAYSPAYHGTNIDGLVIEAQFFGAVPSTMSVAAHELGHYLGLYHTFEGGCTNNNCLTDGDRICDTPPDQSTAAVPCGQTVNTCSTDAQSGFTSDQPDMTHNFLDYGDINCFHDFTPGQAARMIFFLNGPRHSLLDSKACLPPCTAPVVSAFSPSAVTIMPGQTVNFTNISQDAGAYQWSVNGTPFSTATNASYTFATPGIYNITLLAQPGNVAFCDPATSQQVIEVVCAVIAQFTVSNDYPAENEPITITNTSQHATIFSWSINGVNQGPTLPTATFTEAGVYTIQLTAGDGVCQQTTEQQVFVRDSCAGQTFQMQLLDSMNNPHATADAVAVLTDGGTIVVSSKSSQYNLYITKLKPDGSVWWVKTIAASVNQSCSNVVGTADGGFILGLNDNMIVAGYIAKFNADGAVEWMQRLTGVVYTQIKEVVVGNDQSVFVLADGGPNLMNQAIFAKFDPFGAFLWARDYISVFPYERWRKIAALPDGGVIGVGNFQNDWGQVLRFDANGNLLWRKRLGVQGFYDVAVTGDGRIFLAASDYSTGVTLLQIDWNCQVLSKKSYYQPLSSTDIRRLIWTDNGLTMVGRYNPELYGSPPGKWVSFMTRFDSIGNWLWNRSYLHGNYGNAFNDVVRIIDGYLVAGTITEITGTRTAWLLKADVYGFAGSCPAQPFQLPPAEVAVEQYEQNFTTNQAVFTLPVSFPIHPDSITLRLICEKACPTNLEICNNNLDDDGDGLFDCLDPDCPCAEDACSPKRNDRWYFGLHAGLDFSTEPPTVLSDGISESGRTSATICDNQGNLLFYTDGGRIYNRFHQVMPHGTNNNSLISSNCIIVPHPGNPALYYFFQSEFGPATYALVDMRLDSGRGDVVATEHFLRLTSSTTHITGMTATRSCTFNGYWLAVYSNDNAKLMAYRIDQNGLQLNPVISPAGNIQAYSFNALIKFSPHGKQLVQITSGDSLQLYSFDADFTQSGYFYNRQTLKLGQSSQYIASAEYSPSGRYLYVRTFKINTDEGNIYQFDLEAGNAHAINNSRVEIATEYSAYAAWYLQLAPNGKIYATPGSLFNNPTNVIHQPDAPGAACQYQSSAINSPPGHVFVGFSNCITSDFRRPHIAFPVDAPDSICALNSPVYYQIKNVPCDVYAIEWSLVGLPGTVEANYQYATVHYSGFGEGQLIVTAHTDCGTVADTLPINVYAGFNKTLDLGPDHTVCDNGVFTFNAGDGFAQYRWQNGSTDSVLTTVLPGKYWVDVYDRCGNRQSDTVLVQIASTSVLQLGADRMSCSGTSVGFERPAAFTTWQWSPATALSCDTCVSISAEPGTTVIWTVLAQTADGCLSLDTLRWQIMDTLFATTDTTICIGQTVDFYGITLPADTTAYFTRPSLGPGCDTLFTVQVLGVEPPVGTLQAQICPDAFLDFHGHLLPSDTTAVFFIPGPGCDSVFTVEVKPFPPIVITLPADTSLLIGASLTLPAAANGPGPLSFHWQPGTDLNCTDCLQPEASPSDTTTYLFQVTDANGCLTNQSITVYVNPDCRLIIPNAFTPNGDGVNDWFYPNADPCVRTVRLWRVVNRWGQVVFERRNFAPNQDNLGWDGQWQGQPAASDVLVWMAELEYFDGRVESRRGEVTLLR